MKRLTQSLTASAALLLVCAPHVQAAVGIPENIILFRDNGFTQNFFVQGRESLDNFDFPTGPMPFLGPIAGGIAGVDIGNYGDVNGDGYDDLMLVRPGPFNPPAANDNDQRTFAIFTIPGSPPTFGNFFTPDAIRTDGFLDVNAPAPTAPLIDETTITRRDFDGDTLADTAIVLDGSINFGADVMLWSFAGTFNNDVGFESPSSPLNQGGKFYAGATTGTGGEQSFGTPSFDAIPLVGDFNGDGIADRAVSNSAGIVSGGGINGRQVQIDLSPGLGSIGALGDAVPDNPSQVIGVADGVTGLFADTDDIRAADINGDGLDDLVAIAPFDLDDGMGGTILTWELNGFINQGVFDGVTPSFQFDPNFVTFAGSRDPMNNDTIHFAAVQFLDLPTIDADFDNDGDTDVADLMILQRGFGVGSTNAEGDTNADTVVDGTDLSNTEAAFGDGEMVVAAVGVVPEPSAVLLAAAAGLVLAGRRKVR